MRLMYRTHFHLALAPFSITPDPRFVYLTERHGNALSHLLYGLGQGGSGGFVLLTGEVGTGKTTLCRLALEQLPSNTDVALVLNPSLNPLELLETICEELKLDVSKARGQMKPLVDLLNAELLAAHAGGRRVVLMLDEAQNLSSDSLEQVRLLTNLETATQKLLQIILLGQPELNEMLAKPELRQLAQRITARYHLDALDAVESAGYIEHRLFVASDESPSFSAKIFSPAALRTLHQISGGIPRVLNVLADHSLLAGFAENARRVDAKMVRRAATEVVPLWQKKQTRRWRALVVALAAAMALTASWWLLGPGDSRIARTDTPPVSPNSEVAPAVSSAQAAARQTQDQVLDSWLRANQLTPTRELRARALHCPSVLTPKFRCLSASAGPAFFTSVRLPLLHNVDGLWTNSAAKEFSGRYLALYQLPKGAPEVFGRGYAGPVVLELSSLLAARDGGAKAQRIYGPRMQERVITLQRALGIKADGVVGPETWVALLKPPTAN
jgi:general secretion pathway protein A